MAGRSRSEMIKADLSAIGRLLDRVSPDSALDRAGLEYRRNQLAEEGRALPDFTGNFASVELQFGGGPVFGDSGVDARFAARMVDAFQRAVATAAASAGGAAIGSRGPLPDGIARLHVTDVVRGSFGFRLEELGQQELHGSKLREAVAEIEGVLESLTKPDDEAFVDAVENVDPRVVTALRDFMTGLDQASAVCRVIAQDREVRFDSLALTESAAKRIQTFQVTEEEDDILGILWGVLPESRRFEFKRDDEMLKGRLGKEIGDPVSLQSLSGHNCIARIRTTIVQRPQGTSRRLTLLKVEEGKTPKLI